ncbi:MAG TPA: ABC transporter permease [Solirubrobacteraceae bacterium]|jgi:peptide/nickel transport system permease protein|nr:ABC transporter permease [Solirubrobacteraceae bacterium]
MAPFLLRRVLLGLLTLLLVSIVVFAATQALPGNAAIAILGRNATPARVAALTRQLHLDRSVVSQYTHWLGGVVSGNLGTSAATQAPVSHLISARLLNSAFLVIVSAIIAVPLSIALGVWMAVRRDKPADHILSTATLALASLPDFVIGLALALLLATNLAHVFPAVSIVPPGEHAWNVPKAVVLPAATLIIAVTPYISRIMRASMIEVLESEYVTMARLKGLPNRTVIWRHAVPNAIVPAIQVSALQLAYMAGGVVLVEFVFSYPGIGAQLVDSVGNRDIPVVQALAIIIAAVYVVVNLVADLLTIVVTPRLRTAGR